MRNLGLSVPSLALQLLSSAAVPGFFWNADENPLSLLMTGITHSRPSLAYMVDASGKYTTCPNNLLMYSNDFSNAAWNKTSVTVTSGVSDPLGGTSACTMTATATNGNIYQGASIPTSAVATMWIRRRTGSGAVQFYQPNNTPVTVTVTSSWQQFSQLSSVAGTGYCRVLLATSGDAVDIYFGTLSAVTYETAPRPDDLVQTTSSAFYGLRCSYDTPTKRDLLIEDARTNYLAYSESPGTWSNWNLTYAYAANSKLGTLGVTTLTQTLSNTTTSIFFANSPASVNGDVWTFTAELIGVGAKTSCYPALYASVSGWGVNGDATAKILSGPGSLSQAAGGLWILTGMSTSVPTVVAVTRTIRQTESVSSAVYLQSDLGGTAGDQIKVACPQLEKGPYSSSYTPTWSSATPVARGADICQFTGPAIAAIQGAAATVIVQTTSLPYSPGGNSSLVAAGAGNSVLAYVTNSNAVGAAAAATYNQTTALTSGTPDYTAPMRIGVSYSAAGRSLSVNGGAVVTDANSIGNIPSAYLGSNGSSLVLGGRLKSVAIFKSRLADPSLQARSVAGASIFS